MDFIISILNSVDKKNKTVGIFLDLTREFCSVNLAELIKTIYNLGIDNDQLAWFKFYLEKRKQYTVVKISTLKF